MRVTSKGQVTIPKAVREKLGIEPGDEIGFREEGRSIIVEKGKAAESNELADFSEAIKRMRKEGRIEPLGMTVDAYMDMIRGYSEDADDPGFKRDP